MIRRSFLELLGLGAASASVPAAGSVPDIGAVKKEDYGAKCTCTWEIREEGIDVDNGRILDRNCVVHAGQKKRNTPICNSVHPDVPNDWPKEPNGVITLLVGIEERADEVQRDKQKY